MAPSFSDDIYFKKISGSHIIFLERLLSSDFLIVDLRIARPPSKTDLTRARRHNSTSTRPRTAELSQQALLLSISKRADHISLYIRSTYELQSVVRIPHNLVWKYTFVERCLKSSTCSHLPRHQTLCSPAQSRLACHLCAEDNLALFVDAQESLGVKNTRQPSAVSLWLLTATQWRICSPRQCSPIIVSEYQYWTS